MLIPSRIRSTKPLEIHASSDGIYSFVNAYDGEDQVFFDFPPTVAEDREGREAEPPPEAQRKPAPPASPPSEQTGGFVSEPVLQGSEEELWAKIWDYLFEHLDPEKVADADDVRAVYEHLKHSGSQCVSQIAIETGLPLQRIYLALRQLTSEGAVEWRPDRSGMKSLGRVLRRLEAGRLQRHRPGQRNGSPSPPSRSVRLIETAWSLTRLASSHPWNSRPRQPA
jgi:hypothetical protein